MPAHLLQPSLPSLAREYQDAQRRRVQEALTEIDAQWRQFGNRFDVGWGIIRPVVLGEVTTAQADLGKAAAEYVPAVMEETRQRITLDGIVEPNSMVGLTGSGLDVGSELDWTPVRAKQAVTEGATPLRAREVARQALVLKVSEVLLDSARGIESASMASHGAGGWVRVVNGGACVRCVILAGKWYRWNKGFLRHPRCMCVHIPSSESLGSHWQSEPQAYFDRLSEPQQIKLMGSKANAQAVREGADIAQVANIYRKTSGLSFAQQSPIKVVGGRKFTTEGTTRRGRAGQQQAGLRRNGPQQMRPTPETIAMRAGTVEERQRLMRLYGYIVDDEAAARGRAVFAEARRRERNARRAARRKDSLPASRQSGRSAGAGSGGGPPVSPIGSSPMDGEDPIVGKAQEIHAQAETAAKRLEPIVVRAIEDSAGNALRLDTQVKDLQSLTRKLRELDRRGRPLEVNDSVRYTAVFSLEDYWMNTHLLIDRVEAAGFTFKPPERLGWREEGYRGINLTFFEESTGLEFEVQAHTGDSFLVSEQTHVLYEELRERSTARDRKKELRRLIDERYSTVTRPPHVPVIP